MFSPSKESQAAGRAFIRRITARTENRDIPVSDETKVAHRAAARAWGAPAASRFASGGPALAAIEDHVRVDPRQNAIRYDTALASRR